MKYPEIFYYNIIEIWPKELDEAVKLYCSSVHKKTYEEMRREAVDEFRHKLFGAALEYQATKKEMDDEK